MISVHFAALAAALLFWFVAATVAPVKAWAQSMSGNFSTNYTLTGDGASDMVAIAKAQVGKSQSNLGYTEAWCADFVSDCAKLAGQSKAVPFNANCQNLYNAVVNAGGSVVTSPKKGDLVFYNWDHVALMIDSTNCISGNQTWGSDTVSKVRNVGYSGINPGSTIRFVRPKYVTSDGPIDLGENFYATISSKSSGANVADGKNSAWAQAFFASTNDSNNPAQIYHFIRQSDNSYRIANQRWKGYDDESWYLQADNAGTANGTAVNHWKKTGSDAQLWYIYKSSAGGYNLVVKNSGKAMRGVDGATATGTKLEITTRSSSAANQAFNITKISGYSKPDKPAASSYTGATSVTVGNTVQLTWSASALKNSYDKRLYNLTIKDSSGTVVLSAASQTGTSYSYTFASAGTYTVQVRAINDYYYDYFTDSASTTITVNKRALSQATVSSIANQTYTGSAITPKPTVTWSGTTLVNGTDYTLSYSNNTAVGTATITITGKGNYTGTKTVTFKIVSSHAPGWAKENGAYYYYDANGVKVTNNWASYEGTWYYLGSDGKVLTNGWATYAGVRYYMGANGKATVNNWVNDNGVWYYMGSNGQAVVDDWVNYNGKWYYMGSDGHPLVDEWFKYNGTWYYFGSAGYCTQTMKAS